VQFFDTEELILFCAENYFAQKLCKELENQFSIPKLRKESDVKPLEEKNSSIAKELGMTVATAKTEFL
jgi:hypothetical protein